MMRAAELDGLRRVPAPRSVARRQQFQLAIHIDTHGPLLGPIVNNRHMVPAVVGDGTVDGHLAADPAGFIGGLDRQSAIVALHDYRARDRSPIYQARPPDVRSNRSCGAHPKTEGALNRVEVGAGRQHDLAASCAVRREVHHPGPGDRRSRGIACRCEEDCSLVGARMFRAGRPAVGDDLVRRCLIEVEPHLQFIRPHDRRHCRPRIKPDGARPRHPGGIIKAGSDPITSACFVQRHQDPCHIAGAHDDLAGEFGSKSIGRIWNLRWIFWRIA